MRTLDEIAKKYGTDKSSKSHHYTQWYEQYLESKRQEPITVLELGWGGHEDPNKGGASAQMWRDYFPSATVVCVDNEEKTTTKAHDGINFRLGSQADPEFIKSLTDEFGPFDFIVDDASHLSSLTIKSFELLYEHLVSGGIYVVEDTHMAYHDFYYGKEEANSNPDLNGTESETAMNFFKRMADEVNFKGRGDSDWDLFPAEHSWGYDLEFIHFYFNILFLQKR